MHYGNITSVYHSDCSKYMKVEGSTSEDVFNSLFDIEATKFLSKKERDMYMIYLKNGIQSILNLMKILMLIWKMIDLQTLLEMKACII